MTSFLDSLASFSGEAIVLVGVLLVSLFLGTIRWLWDHRPPRSRRRGP